MEELRDRVEAVERALTDGDGDLTALAEGAARAARVEELETHVEELGEDVAELEAATQALRGYVGNVRSVNESVEERADAALAAVDSIEDRVDELAEDRRSTTDGATPGRPAAESSRTERAPETASHVEARSPSDHGGRDVCHACGRSDGQVQPAADERVQPAVDERVQPAADGGSRDPPTAGVPRPGSPERDEEKAGVGSTPAVEAGGRSVGGFDPTDESHRVRIQRSGPNPPNGGDDRTGDTVGGTSDTTPGLLARVRELL